jgi:hypothetical protein
MRGENPAGGICPELPGIARSADHFHPHRCDAGALHADGARGAVRQIDRPIAQERTTVVDPDRPE